MTKTEALYALERANENFHEAQLRSESERRLNVLRLWVQKAERDIEETDGR